MKRGIFYDYGNGKADLVIDELKKQGVMDAVVWVENLERFELNCTLENRTPIRMPDYDWFNLREGVIENYSYQGASKDIKADIAKDFQIFLLNAAREDTKAHANVNIHKNLHHLENSSVYAIQNIFFILIEFFTGLIKDNKIEVVYFNNIPHEGADVVLYLVAKRLHIKTILTATNVLFPNKFFYYASYNDYGDYKSLPDINPSEPYTIAHKGCFKPAYPNSCDVYKRQISTVPMFLRQEYDIEYKDSESFFKKVLKISKEEFYKVFNRKKYLGKYAKSSTPLNTAILNTFYYLSYQKYMKNLAEVAVKDIDFDKKYVFFALHLQPECTTLAFGRQYNDQILAIEAISDLIPDDWKIYVKEHHVQGEIMRDPVFFTRLKGLKKVVVADNSILTSKLAEHSQLISTITGTIGWEAVCAGKNVLCFGNTYYQNFPGVFKYHDGLKFEDISEYKVDFAELEKEIAVMRSKMLDGVIDCDYVSLCDSVIDVDENILNVVNSLKKVI